MDWQTTQEKIRNSIKPGTNLNTPNSTFRSVLAANVPIESDRYSYKRESGFIVAIGQTAKISIPWSMLKTCFLQLQSPHGYDGDFFRRVYPLQAKDHGCHIHVVGQIFVAAGIARMIGNTYRIFNN